LGIIIPGSGAAANLSEQCMAGKNGGSAYADILDELTSVS